MCVCAVGQSGPCLCDPWIVALQVPSGLVRQEYWSGLPFLPPGDLPDPEIKPVSIVSPALQVDSSSLSHQGSAVANILGLHGCAQLPEALINFFLYGISDNSVFFFSTWLTLIDTSSECIYCYVTVKTRSVIRKHIMEDLDTRLMCLNRILQACGVQRH